MNPIEFVRRNYKKVFASLVVATALCATAYMGWVEWRIRQLSNSSPTADAQYNFSNKKNTFLGVYDYSLSVPGVPNGQFNQVVESHELKSMPGTGDFFFYKRIEVLQRKSISYASKYNAEMMKSLLNFPDEATASVLAKARDEVALMRSGKPLLDSLASYKSANPQFIYLSNDGIIGLPKDAKDTITGNTGIKFLYSESVELFENRNDFDRVVKNYVVPYNKNLYNLLAKRG